MKRRDLESLLLQDLKPVKPLASLSYRTLVLPLAAVAIAALLAAVTGWKGWQAMDSISRLLTYPLIAGLLLLQAVFVAREMEPGQSRPKTMWTFAVLIPALLLIFPLGLLLPALDPDSWMHGIKCFGRGTMTFVAVFAGLAFWLRRGYFVSSERAGTAIGILAGLGAFFSQELYCPIVGEAWHVGLAHIGVVVTAGMIGFLAGRFSPPGFWNR